MTKSIVLQRNTSMKSFSFLLVSALSVLLAACGCPELTTGPVQDPRVYNQTITEFNAGWNPPADPNNVADRGSPVPRYSIATFQFPADASSSGQFPNDDRFSGGLGIELDRERFTNAADGRSYTALMLNPTPSNRELQGDIMVVSVDLSTNPRTARLRFSGRLFRFNESLSSGSATDFIEFIRRNANTETQLSQLRGVASVGGAGLGSPSSPGTDIIVIDSLGREVTNVLIPDDVRDRLSSSDVETYYDITVEIGEVYYYVADNGVEFAIHIEDIFEASLAPNQRRVTIKFAALHGPELCPT